MQKTDDVIIIHERDSVAVAVRALSKNEQIRINGSALKVRDNIPVPHKVAVKSINKNDILYKYASPIGFATQDITAGDWVHLHNLHSNLDQSYSYKYRPEKALEPNPLVTENLTFQGYPRADGGSGERAEQRSLGPADALGSRQEPAIDDLTTVCRIRGNAIIDIVPVFELS